MDESGQSQQRQVSEQVEQSRKFTKIDYFTVMQPLKSEKDFRLCHIKISKISH